MLRKSLRGLLPDKELEQKHWTYLPPIPNNVRVLLDFMHQRYVLIFIPTFPGSELGSSIVSDSIFLV